MDVPPCSNLTISMVLVEEFLKLSSGAMHEWVSLGLWTTPYFIELALSDLT
jgi:hypothetical protein